MSGGVPSWARSSSSAAMFGEDIKPAPSSSVQEQSSHAAASVRPAQKSVMRCAPTPFAEQHADQVGARTALLHVIALQASRAGFDASTSSTMHEMERLTERFLTGIFAAAQHAAELACRDSPSARDLVYALETHGQSVEELQHFRTSQEHQHRDSIRKAHLAPRTSSAISDVDWMEAQDSFLPSDSDQGSEQDSWSVSSDSDGEYTNRRTDVEARVYKHRLGQTQRAAKRQKRQDRLAERQKVDPDTQVLMALESGEAAWHRVADHIVPRHLPGMPPRHTWVQTAAYPTNAYSASDPGTGLAKNHPLVLVNRKLANARLVESSLRRLIQNTDGATATAYSASRKGKARITELANEDSGSSVPPMAKIKAGVSPRSSSPFTATVDTTAPGSGPAGTTPTTTGSVSAPFAAPKTPARNSVTLRLKNKMSNNSSTASSPTVASPVGQNISNPAAASIAPGLARRLTMPTAPGTPLGQSGGMSMLFGTASGFDPLMSPLTPVTGLTTPSHPPITPGGSAHTGFNWTLPPGLRSRANSIAIPNAPNTNSADVDPDQDADWQLRIPGAVNYKNVWYAPGSTIQSGGIASAGVGAKQNHAIKGRSAAVKRLRKWKV